MEAAILLAANHMHVSIQIHTYIPMHLSPQQLCMWENLVLCSWEFQQNFKILTSYMG